MHQWLPGAPTEGCSASLCTMSKGKMTQKCFSTPETSLWDEPSVSGIPSLEGWGELQDGFNSGSEERESPTSNSLRLPLSKLLFTEPRPLSSSQLSIHTCQVQNTVDLEYKSKKGKKKKKPQPFCAMSRSGNCTEWPSALGHHRAEYLTWHSSSPLDLLPC